MVERLEAAWASDAAFTHDVYTITEDGERIALEFATWWDNRAFFTGCIYVVLRE